MKPANIDNLLQALSAGLQAEITRIGDEEAKKAAETVERRVRETVSRVVGNVSNYYSHERFGDDLRITVRFPTAP